MTGIEYLLEHLEMWKALYEEETADLVMESASQHLSQRPMTGNNPNEAQQQSQRPRRRRDRQSQQSQPSFNESALPRHARAAYTTIDDSSINDMQADERAYMRASITNAWVKLDQYYTLLGHSPLFAAAVILHPGHGLRFLEQIWADQAQWLSDAKKSLKLYFERWYLDPNDPSDPFSPSPSPGPQQQHPPKEVTAFEQWVKNLRPRASEIDSELERYYRLEPQTVNDPI
jgi:hypothetical protein